MNIFILAKFLIPINLTIIIGSKICYGYQVSPDPNSTFKRSIEKATKSTLLDLVPFDDVTFSPKLPKNNPSSFLPNDDMITLNGKEIDGMELSPVALPLFKSVATKQYISPNRNAVARKRFGSDDMPSEYWFDNRIHSFGNTGLLGGLHAAVAPLATKLIDNSAYDGEDVRTRVSKALCQTIDKPGARILDLCCGVGMSTRALACAFQDADFICGIDTSPEMIGMARFIVTYQELQNAVTEFKISGNLLSSISTFIKKIQLALLLPAKKILSKPTSKAQNRSLFYAIGNAERVKVAENSFDLVTIMYAFHEIPKTARYRILREARRLLKDGGSLAIIDISTDYSPSPTMLAGEPYLLEYKEDIMKQMKSLQGFSSLKSETVVPGHVHKWVLTRKRTTSTADEETDISLKKIVTMSV